MSDTGLVRSTRGCILKQYKDRGYLQVNIAGKTRRVHQLVLEAFVGPRPDGLVCRHLDGNGLNNHLSNLQWDTQQANCEDKVLHGRVNKHERNGRAVLTGDQVKEIRFKYANEKWTHRGLAEHYGVSHMAVGEILRDRVWMGV